MTQGLLATFTTRRALDEGMHPRQLYRWRDTGEIVELSRGVFRRTDAPNHHWSRWRRHHQAVARRCHQAWNAYADRVA
jgi:hypothetical protein